MPKITDPNLLAELGSAPVQSGMPNRTPRAVFTAPPSPEQMSREARADSADARADRAEARASAADARAAERDKRDKLKDDADPKKTQFDQVAKLADDYRATPSVKSYSNAIASYGNALETPATPEGDLSLVYSYAKIMDPDSVVREGEAQSVVNSSPYAQQLAAQAMKQMGKGGIFTADARKRLRDALHTRMANLNRTYIADRVKFKQQAERYGLNPLDVVGNHAGEPYRDIEGKFLGRPVSTVDFQGRPIEQPKPEYKSILDGLPSDEGGLSVDIHGYDRLPGETDEEYIARSDRLDAEYDAKKAEPELRRAAGIKADAEKLARAGGTSSQMDLIQSGASFNLNDEAAGAVNALGNIIVSPFTDAEFDPGRSYQVGRDAIRLRTDEARKNLGWGGTALEFGGGLLGLNPSAAAPALSGLGGRALYGAKTGSIAGALTGFGSGKGAQNSFGNAALGGALGGTVGAAIPVTSALVGRPIAQGFNRLSGRDPNFRQQIVNDALAADANTPRAAGALMDAARSRGSPMMLADTGENTRALLGAVSRQGGPARTLTREAVGERQAEQGARVVGAIDRDLGVVRNPYEASDELMAQARTTAAPLYDEAYAAPGASNVQLDDLLARPSMRSALQRAERLAREEGRDPTTLGFDLDDNAEVILTRVPSWQTLDYVKRGLDDVVETYRSDVTGRLNLDTEGRAVNNTLRSFLSRVDSANPAYAQARAAYAGPAAGKAALEKGLRALNKGADDIAAQIDNMGPFELEQYRLGFRRAMADAMESKGDFADKVNTLVGSPKKRRALARLFGDEAGFNRFVATLADERAMGQTYARTMTGSPTAERLADDSAINDGGLVDIATDAAVRGVREGGVKSAIIDALLSIRDANRFGAGRVGQETRESLAALLTETDPAVLAEIQRAISRANAAQRVNTRRGNQRIGVEAQQAGRLIGSALPTGAPQE